MSYRPHRFPPLSRPAPTLAQSVTDGVSQQQWQSSVADGFQQGLDEGYRQGLTSGQAQGHAMGLEQGLQEGREAAVTQVREEAKASFEALAAPVDAALKALKRLTKDYQAAQRKEMVDLVARVARQVIRCELTLQPVQLLALVDETLAVLPPSADGKVEVYLNPEDLERIREIDPKRYRRWSLVADNRMEPGECRVKSGDHEVDAGCKQRLNACMAQVSAQLVEAGESAQVAVEAGA